MSSSFLLLLLKPIIYNTLIFLIQILHKSMLLVTRKRTLLWLVHPEKKYTARSWVGLRIINRPAEPGTEAM